MPIGYEIVGQLKVRASPEAVAILEGIDGKLSQDFEFNWDAVEDGSIIVDIGGFEYMSASSASDLDDEIRKLNPHMIEAARLRTEADGERGWFWIGSDEQIAAAERALRIETAREALDDLSTEDRVKLVQEYHDRKEQCPI